MEDQETQEMYDIFVAQGTKMAAAAAQQLQGRVNPAAVGEVLAGIVNRIEEEGGKHGMKFDLTVLLHGSTNIMTNLLELAGIEMDEDQQKETIGHMVGTYIEGAVQSGKFSQDQVVQLAEQAQQSEGLLEPPSKEDV